MRIFISPGSIQLLVGPASALSTEQIKVRSSTRATSVGSEAHQKEFGFLVRRTKVPASTNSEVSSCHSFSEPSHHRMFSGVVRAATSSTQAFRRAFVLGAMNDPPSREFDHIPGKPLSASGDRVKRLTNNELSRMLS